MDGIVGVTGTPGTGKKSVAPLLANLLGLRCLSINDVARSHGLAARKGKEWEVDTVTLRSKIGAAVRPAVLYGHLLSDSVESGLVSRVVVLRCEPLVLKERLAKRGYSTRKLVDNVESELIGLVSSGAYEAFGEDKTFEIDATTTTPAEAAEAVSRVINGEAMPGPRIDWTLAYDTGAKLRSLLSTDDS